MKKFNEKNLPQLGQRVVVTDGVDKGKTGFVYSITQRYESGPLVTIDTHAITADDMPYGDDTGLISASPEFLSPLNI